MGASKSEFPVSPSFTGQREGRLWTTGYTTELPSAYLTNVKDQVSGAVCRVSALYSLHRDKGTYREKVRDKAAVLKFLFPV